ncbi:shikimate kinase, chloroplastic isoform X2 [Physcomitrium patens]|uniref:shikimate kinase, chloroplastic isoform X2 n=2 Tax=Physcomitrium patens TaxID=3218 RepID=UPI003CCE1779
MSLKSSDELIGDLMDYGTVADIFAKYGEEWFRKSEIKEVHEPFVVALGGGAMLRPENWVFQDCGIVVYIDVPPVVLAKRVVGAGVQSRPLFPPECTELEIYRGNWEYQTLRRYPQLWLL